MSKKPTKQTDELKKRPLGNFQIISPLHDPLATDEYPALRGRKGKRRGWTSRLKRFLFGRG